MKAQVGSLEISNESGGNGIVNVTVRNFVSGVGVEFPFEGSPVNTEEELKGFYAEIIYDALQYTESRSDHADFRDVYEVVEELTGGKDLNVLYKEVEQYHNK